MEQTKKDKLCEIYESGEDNETLNCEEICKFINKLGVECEKKFVKKHKSIPIDEIEALDPYYSEGYYIWNFCYNEVFIEFYWEDSIPFSSGTVKLKYVKNMDNTKLENVRREIINFFSCPSYDVKNYDEFIKEYGIQYHTN